MIRYIEEMPGQLIQGFQIGQAVRCPTSFRSVKTIVFSGMGGSAIGGDLLRSAFWDRWKVPFLLSRGYTAPSFVGPTTLFIASSYSGRTEETLASFEQARLRKAKLLVLTSGGKLAQKAQALGVPCAMFPPGYPPRAALGLSFSAPLAVLSGLGLAGGSEASILKTSRFLQQSIRKHLGPSVSTSSNLAKRLAAALWEKVVFVYASKDHLEAVACRWRSQIHENAKMLAACNFFPEMNHNEIVGWRKPQKVLAQSAAVFLRDQEDHSSNLRRMGLSAEIIRELGVAVEEVDAQGSDRLARLFWLVLLGDFMSYYLSVLNRVDPTPVESVERIKKALAG